MNTSVKTESRHQKRQSDPSDSDSSSRVAGPNAFQKKKLRIWLLLGLAIPILGMLPLLATQFQSLVQQPKSLFFPLSIAIGVWLLFRTKGYGLACGLRANISLGVALIGMGLAAIGTYWFSPWIVQFASVVVLFGWALGAFAGTPWTRVFAICCLFAVTVPPPSGFDATINARLQSISSWGCSGFLDAIGVANIVEGNVLQIAEKKLMLSEVSGGADSFSALMAIGMSLVVLRRSTFLVSLATMAAVPLCYLLGNMLRLLAIAFGFGNFESDLSAGTGYFVSATIFFLFSIGCLVLSHVSIAAILEPISLGRGANNLTAFYRLVTSWPETKEWSPRFSDDTGVPPSPISGYRLVLLAVPSLVCILFGGLASYVALASGRENVASVGLSEEQAAMLPSQNAFPNQFGSLRLTGYTPTVQNSANPIGRYSHLWKFEDKGSQSYVSLEFPFQGWRPIWVGYESSGWKILGIEPVDVPADEGHAELQIEEFEMQNPYGLYGYVWYAFFDDQGVPTQHENEIGGSRINIFSRLQKSPKSTLRKYFQVQLFLESGRELTELETQSNRKLFIEVFERIRQQSEVALKKAN